MYCKVRPSAYAVLEISWNNNQSVRGTDSKSQFRAAAPTLSVHACTTLLNSERVTRGAVSALVSALPARVFNQHSMEGI